MLFNWIWKINFDERINPIKKNNNSATWDENCVRDCNERGEYRRKSAQETEWDHRAADSVDSEAEAHSYKVPSRQWGSKAKTSGEKCHMHIIMFNYIGFVV